MGQTGAHNNTSNNKKKQDKHYENSFMMRGTERGLCGLKQPQLRN